MKTNDHDMLVTLNTKVDRLTSDIKDLKDDLITRMLRTETRLDAVDVYHAAIPLEQFRSNSKWVDDIRANFRLMIFLYGLCTAVIGGLIARVAFLLFHF